MAILLPYLIFTQVTFKLHGGYQDYGGKNPQITKSFK